MSDFPKKLVGGAQIVLGGAFVVQGLRALGLYGCPTTLGRAAAQPREDWPDSHQRGTIRTVRTVRVPEENIGERISLIIDSIRRDSLEPTAREIASTLLSGRRVGRNGRIEWAVPPKDHLAEIRAVFNGIRDPANPFALRYTGDHAEVDQFASTRVNTKLNIADCDDMTIVTGSVLRAVGYPVRVRVVAADSNDWSHVYLKVGIPPVEPTRWIALDLSEDNPAGWELENADEAKRTGRPSGRVYRVKDYDV